jgi:hypothetical protein
MILQSADASFSKFSGMIRKHLQIELVATNDHGLRDQGHMGQSHG